jgi:hypothetical protein
MGALMERSIGVYSIYSTSASRPVAALDLSLLMNTALTAQQTKTIIPMDP